MTNKTNSVFNNLLIFLTIQTKYDIVCSWITIRLRKTIDSNVLFRILNNLVCEFVIYEGCFNGLKNFMFASDVFCGSFHYPVQFCMLHTRKIRGFLDLFFGHQEGEVKVICHQSAIYLNQTMRVKRYVAFQNVFLL